MRTFNGTAYFDEFGWHVTGKTAAFLLPMTFINITSLVMLVVALLKPGNREVYFMDHEELHDRHSRAVSCLPASGYRRIPGSPNSPANSPTPTPPR